MKVKFIIGLSVIAFILSAGWYGYSQNYISKSNKIQKPTIDETSLTETPPSEIVVFNSGTELLNQMRALNRLNNFPEAQKKFDTSNVDDWTFNDSSFAYEKNANPSNLTREILLNIYSEYTYALMKQEKYEECEQVFVSATSPYCCYSAFAIEELGSPAFKAFEWNSNKCQELWSKDFLKNRKKLSFPKCNGKSKLSFQIKKDTCFEIQFGNAEDTVEGIVVSEQQGFNPTILMYINKNSEPKTRVTLKSVNKVIPSEQPIFDEDLSITIFSNSTPNTYLLHLQGDTHGWGQGTARGKFEIIGELNTATKIFEPKKEKLISLH